MAEVPTTEVPCEPGSRLVFDWGLGNKIELCSTGEAAFASQYNWQSLGYTQRRPAHSLAPLYGDFQARKQSGRSIAPHPQEVLQYADKVSACLTTDLANADLPDDEATVQLYHERAVWELLRICFVDTQLAGSVTQALVGWLRRFNMLYSSSDEQPIHSELARLSRIPLPEEDPRYWPLLHRLVAVGRVEEAIDLLGSHSIWTTSYQSQQQDPHLHAQYDLMEATALLLRQMPRLTADTAGLGGQPVADRIAFAEQRGVWQGQTRELLQQQELWRKAAQQSSATAQGLQQIAAMLCGSAEAVASAVTTWLELLVAQLQHLYPDLQLLPHLTTLLQRCLQEKGPLEDWLPHTIQDLLEAVGNQEVQTVMQICSTRTSPWLPAHLPDLLAVHPASKPLVSNLISHLGCTQVEFFVLEYAASLAGGPTTWHLALQYLAWCPRHGEAVTAAIVDRVAESADPGTAAKLVRICTARDMAATAATVCHLQGAAALREGRLAEALEWLLRMENRASANAVAAVMLPRISKALADPADLPELCGELEDLGSILQAAAQGTDGQPGSKDTLAFLHDFLVLQRGLKRSSSEDRAHACRALDALLSHPNFGLLGGSQRLQPSLATDLLFQAILLLEQTPPAFSNADAQALLQRFQELQWRAGAATKQGHSGAQRAKQAAVNLALARLLAKTHMQEAS